MGPRSGTQSELGANPGGAEYGHQFDAAAD